MTCIINIPHCASTHSYIYIILFHVLWGLVDFWFHGPIHQILGWV